MEKWMNGGSPVGINVRRPTRRTPVKARKRIDTTKANYKLSKFGKTVAAHRGMPIQMFKDSDKDGVMNALDCQPHNRKEQDVRRPKNTGFGGITNMYARKRQYRLTKDYRKQLNEIQKQEYQRLLELQRIQGETKTVHKWDGYLVNQPMVMNLAGDKLVSIYSVEGKASLAAQSPTPTPTPTPTSGGGGGSSGGGSSGGGIYERISAPSPKPSPAPRAISMPTVNVPGHYSAPKKSIAKRVGGWLRRRR